MLINFVELHIFFNYVLIRHEEIYFVFYFLNSTD